MRRPIITALLGGVTLLVVGLGLLIAKTPAVTASSGSQIDTTFGHFQSGQNCLSSAPVLTDTHASDFDGGAVVLAATFADDFPGSSLDTGSWSAGKWAPLGDPYTPTVSSSVMTINTNDHAYLHSLSTYTHGVVEVIAEFGNGAFQHIGFGSLDLSGRYLIFSTYDGVGSRLYARVANGGAETRQDVGAIPSGLHRYRVEWTSLNATNDRVNFYLDGAFLTSIDTDNTGATNYYLYLSNDGAAPLRVDAAQVTPTYVASGTYTSCMLDASADQVWKSIGWDSFLPTSGTLTVSARTSFDALNWSNWATMPVSGTTPGPAYRYAQYQLQLATTDTITTPIVSAVNLAFDTGTRTLAMTDGGTTQATIGEAVPYTLTLTVPQTSTSNLIITDTLPLGMIYNGNSAVNGISPAPTPLENGNTLTWNFGAGQAVFASSTATITFSSAVANVSGNQQGVVLTNTASMSYSNPGSTSDASENFTVTEPALTVNKIVFTQPSQHDAGDTAAYRVTLTNPGGANVSTAYDAVYTDVLPSGLTLNSPITVTLNGGAIGETHSVLNNTATVTVTTIPVGGGAQIDYTAGLNSAVTPSQNITNTGTVAWTSQPGANPNERSGSGGVNDYVAQSAASFVVADPALSKALASTSVTDTSGSNVTIGEVITYSLPITLPEGTTPSLTVTDTLPSGLAYVNGTGSLDSTGFNGTVGTPLSTTVGNNVVFTFASPITVTADNVTTNNSFALRLRARVLDVPGNQGNPPTILNNSAALEVDSGPPFSSNTVAATVVEPQLVVTKVITPMQVITGTVVTTTITVTNTGTSTAFDAVLTDPVPDNRFTNASIAAITNPGFTFSKPDSSVTTTVTYSGGQITPGQTVVFSFKATVVGFSTLGETFNNTATMTATTLPGVDANERTEPPATGSDVLTFGQVPDITVSKTDGRASAAPGDTLVYTLTVSNVGLVAAPNVRITDTFPSGVTFVSASNGGTNNGGVVTWPVVASIASANSVTRLVTVTVSNPVAAGISQFVNTVRATHDGTEPTPSDNTATDADAVNAAPDLALSKSDGGITVTAGSLISYTLTYTNTGNRGASGVVITETVPANTTFVAGSSSVGWSCANGATAGTVCTLSVGTLVGGATGSTVFAVRVVAPLPNGVNTISNIATIGDDGSNGADPPGNNSGSDTTGVINYNVFLSLIMKGN